jgi:acetyl esterase/lipase
MTTRLLLVAVLICGTGFAQTVPPPVIDVPSWVRVEANISYDQYQPATVLDILQPATASLGKRPGVIVIHGGGWVNGTKEGMVKKHCMPYLEKGFVVCNVEYRLAKAAKAPAAVSDVLKAAKWFRDNAKRYSVDTDRIVVTGGSAGGHLALMVGLTPGSAKLGPEADVAAVVNWYGITDVMDQVSGPNKRKYAVEWLPAQDGRMELARLVSPLTYVRKKAPAILTIHGDADPTVPYDHGVRLTRALRDKKADAELISVPGGGHGFGDEQMERLYRDIFKFLKKRKVVQ